ncbi:MAG: PEP/pyruvate-binding domain-containing protein [Thermodesulfobacteriota bacterium]
MTAALSLSQRHLVTRFQRFRKILTTNTAILERLADLERALGGALIFDQAFLAQSAAELVALTREVVTSLNLLVDGRYTALYQRLEEIGGRLASLALGLPEPGDCRLAIPCPELHGDEDGVVGAKNACLGEIGNDLGLPVPDGFALTRHGFRLFLEENGLPGPVQAILDGPASVAERGRQIAPLLERAAMPAALRQAVAAELARLAQRLGRRPALAVRSSAVGEDGVRSFAGQFSSVLQVPWDLEAVLAAVRQVWASRFGERLLGYAPEAGVWDLPMAVAIQEMIPAQAAGIMHSLSLEGGRPAILITAVAGLADGLAAGSVPGHRFLLGREHPFRLVASEILPSAPGDAAPLTVVGEGLRRGSSPVSPPLLGQLAEKAMILEKALVGPQEIEWAWTGEGAPVILQSRPLLVAAPAPPPPAELAAELAGARRLLAGRGCAAQIGIASGPVIQVRPDGDPAAFPWGGIAVARHASPRLSAVARKAAAIITEIGGPTGHLAAVCREYRTPALFGADAALAILEPGTEVTVDVEERVVYAGRLPALTRLAACRQDPHPVSAEAATLRRMLRQVAPLFLTDPASPDFRPERCRTLHDIIRFCHEKAVSSLIGIHAGGGLPAQLASLELVAPIPLGIRLIDLGGGLLPGAPARGKVGIREVACRPFAALLAGLTRESAWDREPVPLSVSELFASLSRPLAEAVVPAPYAGLNLAIIAAGYCNLSLRLGYHFNVIDSYLAERSDDNYIYFRFVGGFAGEAKRLRRLRLIATVLTGLGFRVEATGDLLVAKVKMLEPEAMEAILARLGELVGFTRQLDARLADDQAVDHHLDRFLAQPPEPRP